MLPMTFAGRAALLLCLLGLLLFPLVGERFYVQLLTKIMILGIFAMSLDLLIGFTGLVSLGHAAFFGIGAYTLVMLSPKYDAVSLWTSLPAALALAALAALAIGVFVLRTSGVYFIMATLAFAQMIYSVAADSNLLGGSDGLYIYSKPDAAILGWRPFDLEKLLQLYYVVLGALVLVAVLLAVMLRSLFGRVIIGIRANEHRMRSLGFPVFRYKLASFVIAGALAGLAGYLRAAQVGAAQPELLGWHNSGDVLIMVILGGMGTLLGPVLGAFALVVLQELFSGWTKHWLLLQGGFIILAVLLFPEGLVGAFARLGRRRPPDPAKRPAHA
jgi:branched-chain amino acid transport system permease protein